MINLSQAERNFLKRRFSNIAAVHDEDLTAQERRLERGLEGVLLAAHLMRPSGGRGRKTEERPGTWWALTLRGIWEMRHD